MTNEKDQRQQLITASNELVSVADTLYSIMNDLHLAKHAIADRLYCSARADSPNARLVEHAFNVGTMDAIKTMVEDKAESMDNLVCSLQDIHSVIDATLEDDEQTSKEG